MTKERTSLSLDRDVASYLSRDAVNASGLVNQLVKQHMNGGASEDEIVEFRKKQVKSEYEDLVDRARRKIEEYNELEQRSSEVTAIDDDKKREKLHKLKQVPDDPDHPLVQEIAHELDMTPEQALTESNEL